MRRMYFDINLYIYMKPNVIILYCNQILTIEKYFVFAYITLKYSITCARSMWCSYIRRLLHQLCMVWWYTVQKRYISVAIIFYLLQMHICHCTVSTRFDLHTVLMVRELLAPILPHEGEASACIIEFIEENIYIYITIYLDYSHHAFP